MNKKRMIIIGAGKRTRTDTLPVLERLEERYTLLKIYDKVKATVPFAGRELETEQMKRLDGAALEGVDLIDLAVTKGAVPQVLKGLSGFDLSGIDVVIETPVVLFKHYFASDLLKRFNNAWVAEDCTALPCHDVIRKALDAGLVGDLKEVVFDRSAYKYHGLAALKTWLNCSRIVRAARKKTGKESRLRRLRFANGRQGLVHEPRDYTTGRLEIVGSDGAITDDPDMAGDRHLLEPLVSGGEWTGFRLGDVTASLDETEAALLKGGGAGQRVMARMDDMKRVGLHRLYRGIHEGKGAYPLEEALDDMVIDYYLDKAGFYVANPLMSVKSPLGRAFLRSFTRLVSRGG